MADNLFNKPLIRVENLFKIFGENDVKKPTVNAIDNVSLEINRGDVMVIIGPSGSGKSTFLRSLNLLEKPSSGHIYVNEVDITDKNVDIDKHRQKMGMVFQHFNLFPHLRVSSPADRSSVSPSFVRLRCIRTLCSSTSLHQRSIPRWSARSLRS